MLNDEQIQHLYRFCESKNVQYYDVQVELVDHLANAIETRMQDDPALSFESALDKTYKEFGIFGFSKIVSTKQQAVMDRQRRFYYDTVKDQFRWPKLILLLLLTLTVERLVSLFSLYALYSLMVIIFFSSVVVLYYVSGRLGSIRRQLNKKLVIAEYMYRSFWLHVPIYLQVFSNRFLQDSTWITISSNDIYRLIFSFCFAVYIIFIQAHYQTFKSVETSVKEGFPELLGEK